LSVISGNNTINKKALERKSIQYFSDRYYRYFRQVSTLVGSPLLEYSFIPKKSSEENMARARIFLAKVNSLTQQSCTSVYMTSSIMLCLISIAVVLGKGSNIYAVIDIPPGIFHPVLAYGQP
jgi:hypothetical protein